MIEKKYYDGLTFHRIVKDFMVQGGDPKGTGIGGPGYKFPDEIKGTPNKHEKYSLAMANSGRNTNGSQFFIVTKEDGADFLDTKDTVFGKVTRGFEVVDKMNSAPTGARNVPDPSVKIISIRVLSKQNHEYVGKDKSDDPR